MKEAFYFPHDCNARHDPKLVTFCEKYKNLGYACFFMTVEMLREQTGYQIGRHLMPAVFMAWRGYGDAIKQAYAEDMLNDMLKIGLLKEGEENGQKTILSPSLMRRMAKREEIIEKKREAGLASARARNICSTDVQQTPNKIQQGKEIKERIHKDNILSGKPDVTGQKGKVTGQVEDVIDHLNTSCRSRYSPLARANIDIIKARMAEGRTVEDFKIVIDKKTSQWLGDEKMAKYLRPETLFSRSHFESYLNEPVHEVSEKERMDEIYRKAGIRT